LGLFCFICLVCRRSPESSPPTSFLRRPRAVRTPAPSADTRRAGLFASASRFRARLRRNVCTLYLVFKEPRHPSAPRGSDLATRADCPVFPTAFAFASAAPFGGTLRDYRAFRGRVNPYFVPEPVL
jgi:hypothetical protein